MSICVDLNTSVKSKALKHVKFPPNHEQRRPRVDIFPDHREQALHRHGRGPEQLRVVHVCEKHQDAPLKCNRED